MDILIYVYIATCTVYTAIYIHSSREARQRRASLLRRTVNGTIKCSDASVLSKALLMSAILMAESWATEYHVHGYNVTVHQGNYVQSMHAYND